MTAADIANEPMVRRWFESAGLDDDPAARHTVATEIALDQCKTLYALGIRNFHFYTLNRADLVYAICHLLGLRPEPATVKEAVDA